MDAEQSTETQAEGVIDNVSTEATTDQAPEAEKTADDSLGDAGKKALTEERAARKEADKQVTEMKEELSRLRRANAATKGTDLEAIKAEISAEYAGKMAETSLKAEAKGRLVNPADVTLFLSPADFAGKDDDAMKAAVDKLIEERPYLAAQADTKPHWGDVGGGQRESGEPEPKNAVDRMARAYGRKS